MLLTAIATIGVAACGGGGGGGSDGSSGTNPPPPPPSAQPPAGVPQAAPALPVVTYNARSTPAAISEANAGDLADTLFGMLVVGLDVADASSDVRYSFGETNQTVAGPDGGSAHITGRMTNEETGWLAFDLNQYRVGDVTLDGLQVWEQLQRRTLQQDAITRLSFHDLTTTLPTTSQTFSGHMTLRIPAGQPAGPKYTSTAVGTFKLTLPGGVDVYAEGLSVTREDVTGGYRLRATGRIYNAVHGWLDLSFDDPWVFRGDTLFPNHGGAMSGTTEDGRFLRVLPLTPDSVSLQFTTTDASLVDRAAKLDWSSQFRAQTLRGILSRPIADAGPSRAALPGTRVTLTAAHSEHPETAFLNHRWTLRFRPPASAATLAAPSSVNPQITLDQPGRYLIQLDVSDGIRQSTDFVSLFATPQAGAQSGVLGAQLGPSQQASLGATVNIDMTRYRRTELDERSSPLRAEVWDPTDPTDTRSPMNSQSTFVASAAGLYQVRLYHGSPSTSGTFAEDFQWIAVDTPVHFLPPASFSLNPQPEQLYAADLNRDGRSELIVARKPASREIDIYYGATQPSLLPPITLHDVLGEALAIGDVTSDGRPDIVASDFGGPQLYIQRPDGTFEQPPRTLRSACGFNLPHNAPVIVDFNGDSHADIVTTSCPGTIEYHLQRSSGGFEAARTAASMSSSPLLAGGDLNGDGIGDIALTANGAPGSGNSKIGILYGDASGVPHPVEFLPYEQSDAYNSALAIADVSGDGREDLLFASRPHWLTAPQLFIYRQSPNGSLSQGQLLDAPSETLSLKPGDYNYDGRVDIAKFSLARGFTIHYQLADGSFGPEVHYAYQVDQHDFISPDATGDFDGDGSLDIVYGTFEFNTSVAVLLLGTR